jgi:hypothetical protein
MLGIVFYYAHLLVDMMMIMMMIMTTSMKWASYLYKHRISFPGLSTYTKLQNVAGLAIPVPLCSVSVRPQFSNIITVRNNVIKAQRRPRAKIASKDECSGHAVVGFKCSYKILTKWLLTLWAVSVIQNIFTLSWDLKNDKTICLRTYYCNSVIIVESHCPKQRNTEVCDITQLLY